eukprot:gnl/MRDRNA2_/MRDRNA2_83425_c0_seq1.p1 gnl/MRDRNA2_/MRDRNA2_83425_c0~~gnl/MRDRNA2_/MRDRNA2_83425_c0_seq1.p1  ORF type:complete len:387 (-),score=111.30 gnl/MRDRNA2_/MRDRNA2_83425_c0_seq1:84-1244(-)
MKSVVFLVLAITASALTKPKGPRAFKEKQVLESTTRHLKSMCKDAKDVQEGEWISLKQNEYAAAPEGSGCNPQKMMWEPTKCKLPYHSDEVAKREGRVVFVGDSITETSARSFAWFYDKLWAKDLNSCSYQKEDVKLKVKPQLTKAGFNSVAQAQTLQYMEETGFRKNHHWWGCNTSVAYVPTDTPPPKEAVKGFMFALKNFAKPPLNANDTIVVNWGMWAKEKSEWWGDSMKLMMKEYATWKKAKTAPKLIWREVSPTHWGAGVFTYTKELFEKTQTTKGCSPAGGPKQMEHQMQKKDSFPLKNNNMFKDAVKEAGLAIDGVNIEFLPVWRGTAERYEDHQPLTKYQIETGQTIDCTHYCTHGNVNRFWNSALLATISNMKEREI